MSSSDSGSEHGARALRPAFGRRLRGVCVALLVGLSGCAALGPGPDGAAAYDAHLAWLDAFTRWRTSGRVAVDMPEESFSANMRWRQDAAGYRIWLGGPFGQGAVRIEGDAQGVVLRTAEGIERRAATPEQLMASELGLDVPISLLRHWILGRPAPGEAVAAMELDWAGRLAVLSQSGWQVDYLSYIESDGGSLPSRLEIHRGGVRARFVLSAWQSEV